MPQLRVDGLPWALLVFYVGSEIYVCWLVLAADAFKMSAGSVLRTGSACVRTGNVALPGSDACPASTASTLLFRKPRCDKARHCTLQALATVARSS